MPYVNQDVALLVLRVAVGALFIAHGWGKRKMWSTQPSAQMTAGMLNILRLACVAELLGGLGVLFGVLTQMAAVGLALVMLGAAWFKIFKWKAPFSSSEKLGWEIDLLLFATCMVLIAFGPGAYALMK